ncbi:MAG: hypothetical protein ACOCW2_04655, partial [Chitinivibrionales bacterium]
LAENVTLDMGKEKQVYDLYIMSQCPFGRSAVTEMHSIITSFPDIEMNVWFIGDTYRDSVDGTLKFHSLHGPEEVEEEKIWLAVEELYPQHWFDLLYLRVENDIKTDEIIEILELDRDTIGEWVKRYGHQALAAHYRRSNRLQINASPTLLVDGVAVPFEIEHRRLSKELCEQGQNLTLCDSLPECFEDIDCHKNGKVGVCEKTGKKGRCVYREPVSFSFIAVVRDSQLDEYEQQTIQTTRELFPGAVIQILEYDSQKGQEYYKKNDARGLPLFLFESAVEKTHNFAKIASGIEKSGDWYRFKPDVMRVTCFPSRRKTPGSIEMFVDPTFIHIGDVMRAIHTFDSSFSDITVSAAWYGTPDSVEVHADSLTIVDVWLGMQMFEPKRYHSLLLTYLPESSKERHRLKDWVDERLIEKIRSGGGRLKRRKEDIASLEIYKPVELLVDNQRIIPISSPQHLSRILRDMRDNGTLNQE